jgi:hypothetical protein
MKKLLALGDSFTYGEELVDRSNAWAYQVGRRFNLDVVNLGQPGGSNYRALRLLLEQNIDDYALILIGYSHYDRLELADECGVYDSWPGGRRRKFREEAPWRAQIIDYITVHHDDDYLYRQYLMQIILTQSYLKHHNTPYIMMDAFGNHKAPQRFLKENSHIVSSVDTNHFIGWPNETMAEWTAGLPQGPGGHFLEEGHEVVSQKIISFIKDNNVM